MRLTEKDIEYVASLAKLSLDEKMKREFLTDLRRALEYVQRLSELETSQVEPMAHVFHGEGTPMRADRVRESLKVEEVLGAAPDEQAGHFRVPKVL